MFYLKFMCFCTTFIKKFENFIKKQRRYEFLKIIVFWLNGLKILRHEVPTVQCQVFHSEWPNNVSYDNRTL